MKHGLYWPDVSHTGLKKLACVRLAGLCVAFTCDKWSCQVGFLCGSRADCYPRIRRRRITRFSLFCTEESPRWGCVTGLMRSRESPVTQQPSVWPFLLSLLASFLCLEKTQRFSLSNPEQPRRERQGIKYSQN